MKLNIFKQVIKEKKQHNNLTWQQTNVILVNVAGWDLKIFRCIYTSLVSDSLKGRSCCCRTRNSSDQIQWQRASVYICHAALRCNLRSLTHLLTGLKIDPATVNTPPAPPPPLPPPQPVMSSQVFPGRQEKSNTCCDGGVWVSRGASTRFSEASCCQTPPGSGPSRSLTLWVTRLRLSLIPAGDVLYPSALGQIRKALIFKASWYLINSYLPGGLTSNTTDS